MLPTTLEIIQSALKADSTVAPPDRARLLALLKAGGVPPPTAAIPAAGPMVLRWKEAAKLFGCCPRTLRTWALDNKIKPVMQPGRERAYGIRRSDLPLLAQCLNEGGRP